MTKEQKAQKTMQALWGRTVRRIRDRSIPSSQFPGTLPLGRKTFPVERLMRHTSEFQDWVDGVREELLYEECHQGFDFALRGLRARGFTVNERWDVLRYWRDCGIVCDCDLADYASKVHQKQLGEQEAS